MVIGVYISRRGHRLKWSTGRRFAHNGPLIGLEIHAQLATPEKLFSRTGAPVTFKSHPNTSVAWFDAAVPGSLALLNKHAVFLGAKAASALNCEIAKRSAWDRKHYFYPDSPAGYQITQKYHPLAKNGFLEAKDGESFIRIGIEQVQLEQDTGKTTYNGNDIFVDLNRAGSALIEIVTSPSMTKASQAAACVLHIQSLLRLHNISDANMDSGQLRCDVNVSIGRENARVEIKNLSSVRSVLLAADYEIKRQLEIIRSGHLLVSETKGFDVVNGRTYSRRLKEDTAEYRYLPDADLPQLRISEIDIDRCKQLVCEEVQAERDRKRVLTEPPHSIAALDLHALESEEGGIKFYMDVCAISGHTGKKVSSWIAHDLIGRVRLFGQTIASSHITPQVMGDLIRRQHSKQLTAASIKIILQHLLKNPPPLTIDQAMTTLNITDSVNQPSLGFTVEAIIADNPIQFRKFLQGDDKIIMWFIGQAMRKTSGKVDPEAIRKYLFALRAK